MTRTSIAIMVKQLEKELEVRTRECDQVREAIDSLRGVDGTGSRASRSVRASRRSSRSGAPKVSQADQVLSLMAGEPERSWTVSAIVAATSIPTAGSARAVLGRLKRTGQVVTTLDGGCRLAEPRVHG